MTIPSPAHSSSGTNAVQRFVLLDQARGLALLAMIVYHALWDGLQFGLIEWTIDRDLAMQTAAKLIAGTFLVIVGLSLALANTQNATPLLQRPSFWRRVGLIAGAAAVVSLATHIALPQAPIYFGILHHIALASVLVAVISPAHPFVAAALASVVLIMDHSVAWAALNHPAAIWLGLGTVAPVTADWVPLFPWVAAPLLGFAVGKQLLVPWLGSRAPSEEAFHSEPLRWMGQHSLAIYLIHQPILIGLIYAYQGL